MTFAELVELHKAGRLPSTVEMTTAEYRAIADSIWLGKADEWEVSYDQCCVTLFGAPVWITDRPPPAWHTQP